MIVRLLTTLVGGRRPDRLRIRLEREREHLASVRLQSPFRKLNLQLERDRLTQAARNLATSPTIAVCENIERTLREARANCDGMMREETQLRGRLNEANLAAELNRQLAATVPAKSFDEAARRKQKMIAAEIKSFWKCRSERAEHHTLSQIEAWTAELEQMVLEAQLVQKSVPQLTNELAMLPREQIAIDAGAEETFQEINATFLQVQEDAAYGNYHKAYQRLESLNVLKEGLLSRLERRRNEAREQVNLWLDCAEIVERFPQIRMFPAHMSAADIEQWYALRHSIEERGNRESVRTAAEKHPAVPSQRPSVSSKSSPRSNTRRFR